MRQPVSQSTLLSPSTLNGANSIMVGNSMTPIPPAAPSEFETLPGLLRVLRRRWLAVALVSSSVIAVGLVACFIMTPQYSSAVIIEVGQGAGQEQSGTHSASDNAPSTDEIKSEIQTDIGILQSDGLALAVIQQLGLQNKEPFQSAIDPAEKDKPLEDAPRTRERILKLFQKYLKISSPDDTRLINVIYQSPDPTLAASIANTLSTAFIDSTLERQHHSTSQSSYWLQKELDNLKVQVEASEQKLADYERNTGLAGIQLSGTSSGDGTSNVSMSPRNTVTERLFSLNQELTTAEANRISTETIYHLLQSQDPEVVLGLGSMSVSSGGSAGALTQDSGIELVRTMRAQQDELAREYASYAVKYGANNPRLIQLQQQIDSLKLQMKAELERISTRAWNAYQYAKQNEATVKHKFAEQQTEANSMTDKTVQLQVLAQEAYSNRALYERLFSELQTASLASGVRAPRIDVVDKARAAGSPSSPEYVKYIAAIVGFGLFSGISFAFIRESLDETVRTPQHLNESPELPMLGYIPNGDAKGLDYSDGSQLIYNPTSPFSESLRAIRTAILSETFIENPQSILITSAVGGDGKTTVVYNLGVAFAQQGARVLLIDADLRNPDLHRRFGCSLSPGLSDVVEHMLCTQSTAIVRHESLPTLYMLPAGAQPKLPAELFGSKEFGILLGEFTNQYDYVLIDSPPILNVTDASIIARNVGGIVGVVRSGSTTRSLFAGLAQALHRTHTTVLGIVLNDVRQSALAELPSYSYSRASKGEPFHDNA